MATNDSSSSPTATTVPAPISSKETNDTEISTAETIKTSEEAKLDTPTNVDKTTPTSRKGSSGNKGARYWHTGGRGSYYRPYGYHSHSITPRYWSTPQDKYAYRPPPTAEPQTSDALMTPSQQSSDSAAVTQVSPSFSVPAGVTRHIENAITRPCFDWLDVTDAFPRVNPEIDDKALNEALTERGVALMPSSADIKLVEELIAIVLAACSTISSSEETEDKDVQLDEAILVGSYKKMTYIKGSTTGDIVILLDTLPNEALVDKLSKRLLEVANLVIKDNLTKEKTNLEEKIDKLELNSNDTAGDDKEIKQEDSSKEIKQEESSKEKDENERNEKIKECQLLLKSLPNNAKFRLTLQKINSHSFQIISSNGSAIKLVTTTGVNLIKQPISKPGESAPTKLDLIPYEYALRTVRHAKWWEANCTSPKIATLVRVIKNMTTRFSGLSQLHTWIVELICHHAVMNKIKANEPREIGVAFRYILQLISAGCLMLGFTGIEDPCEKLGPSVHYSLTDEAKDNITLSAQILLRMLQNGAYREIVGGEGVQILDLMRPFSVGGTQFAPPQRAYHLPPTTDMETS